jgi:hydrogenase maturation factor
VDTEGAQHPKEVRMCLGEYGTVVELLDGARAAVRFGDGTLRDISLAVLVAEGTTVASGDTVAVSIGMALHVVNDAPESDDEEVARW